MLFVRVLNKKYVWYASYGSNLQRNRFLCYIRGGKPSGSSTNYKGARDNSYPISEKPIILNHELYFAKNSFNWDNGGVAFIKNCIDSAKNTLGRMYLITEEQFCDVVKQETKSNKFVSIDFEKAIRDGRLNIKPDSWYGQLIYLGHKKGFPISTFTNENDLTSFTRPSLKYLTTIIQGIYETYSLEHNQIMNYLLDKAGIKGNYTEQEIAKLINEAQIAMDFPIYEDQGKDKL